MLFIILLYSILLKKHKIQFRNCLACTIITLNSKLLLTGGFIMLAISMGDANGVGPEIILKAFNGNKLNCKFVLIGDISAINKCKQLTGIHCDTVKINTPDEYQENRLNIIDLGLLTQNDINPGEIDKKVAAASREYVVYAANLCQSKQCEAMVTLPVNKEAIRLSDTNFTGHTELIAEITGKTNYTMMLASPKLTVTHVSTHVSMLQAINNVKKQRVEDVAILTYNAIKTFKSNPKIAIAGLNAHSGEGGAFGQEDINEIMPAVENLKSNNVNVFGPIPPDTVFLRAANGEFDAVVAMYHDQGHIPMKLLDFSSGVNITLGLPITRTSVDHGTAYDIAYKNMADDKSFVSAFAYAQKLIKKAD